MFIYMDNIAFVAPDDATMKAVLEQVWLLSHCVILMPSDRHFHEIDTFCSHFVHE